MSMDLEALRRRVDEAKRALAEAEQELEQARALDLNGDGAFRDHGEAARARRAAAEVDRGRAQSELARAQTDLDEDPLARLAELALRGEAKREQSARHEEAQRTREQEAEACAARKRLPLACTSWAFLCTWGGRVLLGLPITIGVTVLLSVWLHSAGFWYGEDGEGTVSLAILGGLAIAALVHVPVKLAVFRAGRLALGREQRWLQGLPFPLEGYEELLGAEVWRRRVRVEARFSRALTADQGALVKDAALGLDLMETDASFQGTLLQVYLTWPCEDGHNRLWRRPLRQAISELLFPLHERLGIAGVKITH